MSRKTSKLIFPSIFRRSERDVVEIYDSFSNLMKIATGGNYLNFGFWTEGINTPYQSQENLTKLLGEFGLFSYAETILDLGSGFSIPAFKWLLDYPGIQVFCINTSPVQIKEANNALHEAGTEIYSGIDLSSISNLHQRIYLINSSSNFLPVKSNFFDRVIAFESAHHFQPFEAFIKDCKRMLKKNGLLLLAIPVLSKNRSKLEQWLDLGILNITWASEHYAIEKVKADIQNNGFEILDLRFIGPQVYQKLADYYFSNRSLLGAKIIKEYSVLFEWILNKSISKMKKASIEDKIEYVLIKSSKL